MIPHERLAELSTNVARLRAGAADAEIVAWLRSVSPSLAQLSRPARNSRGYTRCLLHKTGDVEVVAIHWEPHCVTPIHDHGGALCWLAVAEGSMQVENFVRLDSGNAPGFARIDLEGREELQRGGIDYRKDDVHLHRCVTRDGGATTLHVYSRPIERFFTFDESSGTCEQVSSGYDSILP